MHQNLYYMDKAKDAIRVFSKGTLCTVKTSDSQEMEKPIIGENHWKGTVISTIFNLFPFFSFPTEKKPGSNFLLIPKEVAKDSHPYTFC